MPLAVLTFNFDPVAVLSDTASVRVETIVLAIVLFAGLLAAAAMGRRARVGALRTDDLIFMVVGAVPGAIVGGRLGYVLDHWSFYQANPAAITDPVQGGFTLTLALPFGLLTGAVIGRLLGAPIGRWMHALALPLLFVLAGGKLAGVLGGTGQGSPSELPWATSYAGVGPWGSIAADVPSHPSQVYEAIAILVVIVAMWLLSRAPLIARGDGAAMWAAIGLWCVARFAVAFSWRDPASVGVLRLEQVLALAVALLAVAGLVERARAHRRMPAITAEAMLAAEPALTAVPALTTETASTDAEVATVEPEPAIDAQPSTLDAEAAARAEAEASAEAEAAADPDTAPA